VTDRVYVAVSDVDTISVDRVEKLACQLFSACYKAGEASKKLSI